MAEAAEGSDVVEAVEADRGGRRAVEATSLRLPRLLLRTTPRRDHARHRARWDSGGIRTRRARRRPGPSRAGDPAAPRDRLRRRAVLRLGPPAGLAIGPGRARVRPAGRAARGGQASRCGSRWPGAPMPACTRSVRSATAMSPQRPGRRPPVGAAGPPTAPGDAPGAAPDPSLTVRRRLNGLLPPDLRVRAGRRRARGLRRPLVGLLAALLLPRGRRPRRPGPAHPGPCAVASPGTGRRGDGRRRGPVRRVSTTSRPSAAPVRARRACAPSTTSGGDGSVAAPVPPRRSSSPCGQTPSATRWSARSSARSSPWATGAGRSSVRLSCSRPPSGCPSSRPLRRTR